MRRLALTLVAGAALTTFAAPSPANASLYCSNLGPVPGYGPVCTVKCILGHDFQVDPKDVKGTLVSVLVIVCPA